MLDFGLAKLAAPGPEVPLDHSPTIVSGVTQAGLILGTAAYMSPEQAKGRAVDKRADIWAFGVVLYELATGKALFHGDDVTDVLASVLRDQPNLEELPPQLAPLIKNCLQKDSKLRLRDIADSRLLLDPPVAAAPVLQEPKRSSVMPWIAAAVLGVAAVVFAYLVAAARSASGIDALSDLRAAGNDTATGNSRGVPGRPFPGICCLRRQACESHSRAAPR